MTRCEVCGGETAEKPVSMYTVTDFGFKVTLINGVTEESCSSCAETGHTIPNYDGLAAAVALQRISMPLKLNGADIKLIRSVVNMSGKELAELLVVDAATVSRWENDKQPMTPAYDRLFRFSVCSKLSERAPLIKCSLASISALKIVSVSPSTEEIHMYFVSVKREEVTFAEAA